MARILNHFGLMVKLNYKKRVYLWQLISLGLLLLLLFSTNLPDRHNLNMGVYYGDSLYGKRVLDDLIEKESLFSFSPFESEELLEEAVLRGEIECGLVFVEGFDRRVEERELKDSILYYTNPLDSLGILLEESVYASLFKLYSQELLRDIDSYVYYGKDLSREEALIKKTESILAGDRTFKINTIIVDMEDGFVDKGQTRTYPFQGLIGLMIVLNMYFAYGRKFNPLENAIDSALSPRERLVFDYIYGLSRVAFLSLLGLILIVISPYSRGFLREVLMMMLLLFIGQLYVLLYGSIFKRDLAFISSFIIFIALNLLLAPVFINLTEYLPFLKYLSYLSPLGFYLS